MVTTALERFNSAPQASAERLLLTCAAVPRWAQEIAAGRPYADVTSVVKAAKAAADPWTEAEIDAALARHPRIGERAQGDEADAAHSRREQAGIPADTDALDATGQDLHRRLIQGNRAYEERFGHVFLIRAAGRSAEEILTALDGRMANDAATERRIAAEQLREIAILRLRGELT